jgi:hypothetical protein
MKITIPPELERRLERVISFSYWSAGENPPDPLPVHEYILKDLEESCECAEGDMILDSEGHFLADKLWEWERHGEKS